MTPTSYQAAPPRTATISDEHAPVKAVQSAGNWRNCFCESGREQLPLVVRRVLEGRNSIGIRMNVNHARTRLIRAQHSAIELRHPVRCPSHRIRGNLTEVPRLNQILQGLRGGL